MGKNRTCFTIVALILLLGVSLVSGNQVSAKVSAMLVRPTSTNELTSELLVQYVEMPKSIAVVPSAPAETEAVTDIAPSVQLLSFETISDMKDAALQLEKHPLVERVEPNYERKVSVVPNDTYYSKQWWIPHVKAPSLWKRVTEQTQGTVVAVIDSGIDSAIQDFSGRIATGGHNFVDNSSNVNDVNGHGTSVSGVIASVMNNHYGITGIGGPFDISILPLKTIRDDGMGTVAMNVQRLTTLFKSTSMSLTLVKVARHLHSLKKTQFIERQRLGFSSSPPQEMMLKKGIRLCIRQLMMKYYPSLQSMN